MSTIEISKIFALIGSICFIICIMLVVWPVDSKYLKKTNTVDYPPLDKIILEKNAKEAEEFIIKNSKPIELNEYQLELVNQAKKRGDAGIVLTINNQQTYCSFYSPGLTTTGYSSNTIGVTQHER